MTLRIRSALEAPLTKLRYLNAMGRGRVECVELPVTRLSVDTLPPGLDAILVASDLQGRALPDGNRLLGEALGEHCMALAAAGDFPDPDRTGVVLAGDLYAELGKRGGLGDVRSVWEAFAAFRWVVGVAGNHDAFSSTPRDASALGRFKRKGHAVLDGDHVVVDGLRIGGVSGIVGSPHKPNRRHLEDFVDCVMSASEQADVLVLHEGPEASGLPGNPELSEVLAQIGPPLVICGHRHWPTPLGDLAEGQQVLNVDARAVLLQS